MTATITKPTLLEAVLDCMDIAYWHYRDVTGECGDCRRHPANVCADPDHQDANASALWCEEYRKQVERSPEVLAALGGERS